MGAMKRTFADRGYPWWHWRRIANRRTRLSESPNIIGSKLLAWWDYTRTDKMTLSGAQIVSIRDIVAGYELTQATAAARPLYTSSGFNGGAAALFDGTDDYLEMALGPAALPTGATAERIYVVVDQLTAGATTGNKFICSRGATFSVRNVLRSPFSSVNRLTNQVGTGASNSAALGTTVDFSGRHWGLSIFGATESSISTDGSGTDTVAAVPTTVNGVLRHGANAGASAGGFFNGHIRHVIHTTDTLTDEEQAVMVAFCDAARAA